jgi:hypothetical protein
MPNGLSCARLTALRNPTEFETYVFNVGRELLPWYHERAEVEIDEQVEIP